MTNKKNGPLIGIDVVDEEMTERLNEINNRLKSARKNDILYIATEEKRVKGNIMNNILLKVINKTTKMLTCILDDIETENDGKSSILDKIAKKFGKQEIYIHASDLVKIKKGSLILSVKVGGDNRNLDITNIIQIEVHNSPESTISPQDKEEMGKQEFLKKHGPSEDFLQAIEKTPNFWETLFGASPKGRSQIDKIINKSLTNNSYYTKGTKVKFILLSPTTVYGDSNRSLIPNTKTYLGTMYPNKILQVNDKRTGHFEIEMGRKPDQEEPIFNVKITYCNKKEICKYKGKHQIRVIKTNG